jgi:hypothetical protein
MVEFKSLGEKKNGGASGQRWFCLGGKGGDVRGRGEEV